MKIAESDKATTRFGVFESPEISYRRALSYERDPLLAIRAPHTNSLVDYN
jgi:hypothetical protein